MPVISITPTISTSAYATGDVVGGKLTLEGVLMSRALLTHLAVFDDDGEGVQLDFFLFNADLEGTYTDNAAFAINASDKAKWIGQIVIETGDYLSAGADKTGLKTPINLPLERGANGNEDLFAVCVIRSSTTFTATTDLRFDFGYILD